MMEDAGEVEFTNATEQDLLEIALIHKKSLAIGVLSNCGIDFLVRMYSSILQTSSNAMVVAKIDGKVVGFIVGLVKDVSPLASLDLKALLIYLFNCFRKPYLFFSTLKLLRHLKYDKNRPGDVEISHFAVDNRYRGMGIGSGLISIIEDKVVESGSDSIFTRTHNDRLIEFYQTNFGAQEIARFSTSQIDYVTLKWLVKSDRKPK